MSLVATVLAVLRAAGIDAHDGRPARTPPSDYVIVEDRNIATGHRRYQTAPKETAQAAILTVSRDRQRCRELHARCLALLDETRPYTDPAAGLLQRVDTGPILTDGPDGEVKHSITTIFRCTVPRGAAQAP